MRLKYASFLMRRDMVKFVEAHIKRPECLISISYFAHEWMLWYCEEEEASQ